FDPTEEQFYLPTRPIQLGDGQREKEKIVGQEGQPQVLLGVVVGDAAQQIGIVLRRTGAGQANGLVAAHAAGAIDGARGAKVELQVLFGARDEEGATLREDVEAS